MNIQIIKEIGIKLNRYCLPLIFNSFLNMLFSRHSYLPDIQLLFFL